jgi:hypothetical protein
MSDGDFYAHEKSVTIPEAGREGGKGGRGEGGMHGHTYMSSYTQTTTNHYAI